MDELYLQTILPNYTLHHIFTTITITTITTTITTTTTTITT